jgi:hypothetical protein
MLVNKFKRQSKSKHNQTRVKEQHTSKLLRIQNMAEVNNITMEDARQIFCEQREFVIAKPAYQYTRGQLLVAMNEEYRDLPTYMCQLHEYYMVEVTEMEQTSFKAIIPLPYIFHQLEETKHYISYGCLFQLYQRRSLDVQIMMLWTM